MELESIQSGSKNSDLPKNYKSEAPEGDAKEAFLAVLQGLVGFLSPAQALPANIPVYKIAQLEMKETQRSVKEERSFDRELDKSSNSDKSKDDAMPSNVQQDNTSKEAETTKKSEILVSEQSAEPTENKEKIEPSQQKVEVKIETGNEVVQVVEAQSSSVAQVDQAKVGQETQIQKPVESEGDQLQANIVSVESKASETQDLVVQTDVKKVDIQEKVVKEEVSEQPLQIKKEVVESNSEDPLLTNSTQSEVAPETTSEAKETVKVLNAKPIKREGRSLEDEIEISYFEARDFMSKSLNLQSTQVEKTIISADSPSPRRETLDANTISALLHSSILMSKGFSDLSSDPLMAKNSNIKLDSTQASTQASKAVFDKGSSEKLVNNSFSARTAQAQVMVDKVKGVLEQATLNKTNDTITVKVEPAHLGELTVKVSEKKGQIYAKITPQSKEIEDILRSQSKELSLVIQALGYKEEDVQVSVGAASPDFYSAFSQSSGFQGEQGGPNSGSRRAGHNLVGGMKESGINIDNNLTSEDLVGWIA